MVLETKINFKFYRSADFLSGEINAVFIVKSNSKTFQAGFFDCHKRLTTNNIKD